MQPLRSFVPPADLYRDWQVLRLEQPQLRPREAAAELGVSEAELTASRLGVDAVRLRPEWRELLPALGELGYVMALTRNDHCVHERKGIYREVTVTANAAMGLVVSTDIDLRLFLGGWASVFAVAEQTTHGLQCSIQFFDRQGLAIHKVYLTDRSEQAAWAPLIERFRSSDQHSALELLPAAAKRPPQPDSAIDLAALRSDWARLQDTHHFFAMLKHHRLERTQALRLAGREWAEPLATGALPALFEEAGQQAIPIMVFVGNRHCIQIHTGPVHNLRWMQDWFNVLDPAFNLHLKTPGLAELWRVRKPSSDGIITAWEGFDARGELIIQLFGARKPGMPELAAWRELAESASAREL